MTSRNKYPNMFRVPGTYHMGWSSDHHPEKQKNEVFLGNVFPNHNVEETKLSLTFVWNFEKRLVYV